MLGVYEDLGTGMSIWINYERVLGIFFPIKIATLNKMLAIKMLYTFVCPLNW